MLALQCAWWKQYMICEKKWSDAYCAESTWQFTRPFDAPHICSLYHASTWYCVIVEILKNCSPSQYCNLFCCRRQLVSVRSCKNLYLNKIFVFSICKGAAKYYRAGEYPHVSDFFLVFFWYFEHIFVSRNFYPLSSKQWQRINPGWEFLPTELKGIPSAGITPLGGFSPWISFPLLPN
jgi:hypothetical protein